jgi:uncharacterized protein YneF (UPF0154 family)
VDSTPKIVLFFAGFIGFWFGGRWLAMKSLEKIFGNAS